VTVDGSPAGRGEHMVPPTLSRAWMPGLGSGPRGASVLGPFRVEVCLEIRGKAAWPTTPLASVVTSKLDRQLVACTRTVPEDTLRNQQHSPPAPHESRGYQLLQPAQRHIEERAG